MPASPLDPSQLRPFPGRPTSIIAPHGAQVFEIAWPGNVSLRIPHTILRGFCPCAGCQGHGAEIRYQAGRNSELRDIRPVGNYALSLTWGDAHDTGIYSFEYLYMLGQTHASLGTDALIELGVLPRASVVPAGPA